MLQERDLKQTRIWLLKDRNNLNRRFTCILKMSNPLHQEAQAEDQRILFLFFFSSLCI